MTVRILAEGRIDDLENASIVKIQVPRAALSDAIAQLTSLRYAVTRRLRVRLSKRILDLQLDEILTSNQRAKINPTAAGILLELSITEFDAWLSFLTSCYWHERAPVDHVDLFAFDKSGREYMIVLAVDTSEPMSQGARKRRHDC